MKKFSFILSFVKPYKWLLLIAFISSLIYVACNIYIPIASGLALDSMNSTTNTIDYNSLYFYIYSILGCMLVGPIFYWILSYLANRVSYNIGFDMRNKAFDRILKCQISYLDNTSYGDIISTVVNDISLICDGVVQTFIQLFTGVFTIVATLVMMFVFSWQLALIVFILTPLSILTSSLIAKGTAKTFANQSNARAKLAGIVNENMQSQKVIVANNHQQESIEDFNKVTLELRKYDKWSMFYSSIINPSTRLINSIIYGVVACLGGIFIVNGVISMTTGNLSTFLMFTNNYTNPFNEISEVISQLQTAFASSSRLEKLLNYPLITEENNLPSFNQDGDIKLNHVTFSYSKDKKILDDVSVTIKKGSHVAIVGETGCGKTTLINLIMRFYDLDSGNITIADQDIAKMNRDSLREHIGMVLQDTWIFKGTIKDNIKYANANASDEDIINASKKSNAHFFITQMEKGYDTLVSNNSGLSTGQKQLLCITRLMLHTPEILILDEATSNIDTLNEKIVQEDFDEIMKGKTSIIIAHRLSTIQNADKILFLGQGKILEHGSHEELLKLNGHYAKLYNSQFKRTN
jgi:ATP-binding cassette, subfamily B, multidrug efflux pump